MPTRHFHPFLPRQRHQAVIRDTRQYSATPRRQVFVPSARLAVSGDAPDTDEIRSRALVNIPMVLGVQKQTVVTLRMCCFRRAERRSIVTAHFERTRSIWCGSVHMTVHDKRRAVELTRIVRPDRRRDDDELEVTSRSHPQTGRRTNPDSSPAPNG